MWILMFRELKNLDVPSDAMRVAEDESIFSKPHKCFFCRFKCSTGVDLKMNLARSILESAIAIGQTP